MKAISRTRSVEGGGCIVRLVGVVFLLVGGGLFISLSGLALRDWFAAQSWPAVPCTILSSDVGTHSSSDGGDTYSIEIRYTYEWDGVPYESSQYNFFGGSSSGYSGKAAVVAQYPVGATRECYVNPETPATAVLNRAFSPTYLIGGFGLIFVVIALFLLFHRSRKSAALSESGTATLHSSALATDPNYAKLVQRLTGVDPATISTSVSADGSYVRVVQQSAPDVPLQGPVVLSGGRNSVIGFFFTLVFSLIWNGIMSAALWDALSFEDGASFDIVALLFLVPFLLIGLGMIAATVYFFLSLFNPRADLTMNPGRLVLGGSAVIGWSFRGDSSRIQKLSISLEGRESATYRRGTSTTTDRSTFERIPLFETMDATQIRNGEATVTVPEFTAPTFQGSSNKIEWQLKVRGEIPRWPDVNEEFDVFVLPLPVDQSVPPQPAEFRRSGEFS